MNRVCFIHFYRQGRINSNAEQEDRKRNVSQDGVSSKQSNEKAINVDH